MNAHTPASATRPREQSAPPVGIGLLVRHSALKALTAIGVLAAVVAAAPIADAGPRHRHEVNSARKPAFDGPWSVVIQTERGACDSYRVGIDIVNGAVSYDGTAYGRVSATGAVRVAGSMGDQKAEGSGRLSRAAGRGVWRALSKLGPCSGSWTAERHS